jgi:hypothetical protein
VQGLLGVVAIEKFLAAGWEVVGVSRRKPELEPIVRTASNFQHISMPPLLPPFPFPVWNKPYPDRTATWIDGTNDVARG